MPVPRIRLARLFSVFLAGGFLFGCQSPPTLEELYREDEEQLNERLAGEELLNQRSIVEFKGHALVPFESDLEIGAGTSIKGEMEVHPNLYLGLELGWAFHDVDDNAEDVLASFQGNQMQAQQAAANLDPEQWMESFERYSILFLFDYDVPLAKGDYAPIFRFGVGLGALIITGEEVSDGVFAQDVDSRVFGQFLARPSVGLRFPVTDFMLLFTEMNVDIVPEDSLSVDGELFGGDRTNLGGKVNFSGFNIGGGISFTW